MSHLVPTTLVDSSGTDATDTVNHAVKVNVVAGGAGGGAVTVADGADVAQGTTSDVAWVSGSGTVISLLKKIAAGGGGAAVSIADGSDIVEGTLADAAITSDVNGTISGKMRGLVKILASVWDSVNGRLKVDGSAVTQPVSGTVAVTSAGLTNLDVALSTRTKPADQQHAIVDSGTLVATQPTGTNLHAVIDSGSTTAVTGNVTVVQPTGTNLHVVVDTAPTTAVTGPLTDTQLRATPVPVSGALTATDTYATATTSATWTSATALNTAITLSTIGLATVNFSARKTGSITVGAITVEVSADGTNYTALAIADIRYTGGVPASPYSLVTGIFPVAIIADVAAYQSARLRLSTAITGTGSVDVRADVTAASNSTPVGAVVISGSVTQGNTATTNSQGWWTRIGDAITGPTKVQPASTAPVATDLALTVALSPNGATVQANAGTNLNTSALALDATLTGRTAKVQITDGTRDGTVKAASTLPALTDTAVVTTQRDPLPAGTNVLGHVIADTGSTTAVTGNVTVVQATPANLTATVTPIALTKGTQGATGFSVQDLRDAGRNTRIFMLDTITAAPLVEALATVVQWYGNAAVAGTTTPAVVPAGKTLRLTGYKIQYQSLATVGYAVVRIRVNTAGVAVLASPLVASFEAGSNSGATTAAVTGAVTMETGSFPEGLEIPAAAGIGFSVAGYGPTGALTLEGGVRFEVHGYEY